MPFKGNRTGILPAFIVGMKVFAVFFSLFWSVASFANAPRLQWISVESATFKDIKKTLILKREGKFVFEKASNKSDFHPDQFKLTKNFQGDRTQLCFGTFANLETGRTNLAICALSEMGQSSCPKVNVQKCRDDDSITKEETVVSQK